MKPPEVIRTERLTLRRLKPDDAEDIFTAYAQDPEVSRYLTWRPHQRVEEAHDFVRSRIAAWEAGNEFTWAILAMPGQLIGNISLRQQGLKVDFGYVLARSCWRKGFATEALHSLVRWSLDQPDVFRAWAVCDVENLASARVLEKVGMGFEGVLRGWMLHPQVGKTPRDCRCYAIVKESNLRPAQSP